MNESEFGQSALAVGVGTVDIAFDAVKFHFLEPIPTDKRYGLGHIAVAPIFGKQPKTNFSFLVFMVPIVESPGAKEG